ncbi:vps-8 [Pristionchus pacificus]|uniref:Vps8 domain-containing protein n=1 Tax=Pristionchus pacificus TaxID=54126 RepID=A0A2A6BVI4_PRIPA|nr:vps-8 [Pristionchus pacificus]|eukprot:PDM69924.1 hypothetical protein PRIPAC_49136 [Pristionchus pacificus]
MSIRSASLIDELDDTASWLGSIGDESIPTLSLDDVLKDCSWEEGGTAAGLLEGVSFRDDEFSLLDSGRPLSSALSSTPSLAYTLDCPVRGRMMDKLSVLLMAHAQQEGAPTAMARREARLGVCTSRGTLLLFSLTTENLERAVRCETAESAACCAFSPDGRTVAVGHAKGAVRVINTASGALEFATSTVVQMDRGILQIAFLSNRSLLVLDSGGSVYEVRQKRGMLGTRREESRCVFSGCNGEVVHFALPPPESKIGLLFLVSLTKVLVVSTRHGGAVLCAFPVRGPPDAPPLLDYRLDSPDVLFLLIARGDRLSLYRVVVSRLGSRTAAATLHRTVTVDTKHPLVAARFHHAGAAFLVTAIDAQEHVLSIDLDKGTVAEADPDECTIQCVFATADYKGLAYGGNVSAAMRAVAENAAYSSIVRAGASLLVLGPSIVYELTIMDEQQQLETYYDRHEYISAALFLLDLVRGRLHARDPHFIAHIHMRVAECLRVLLDHTATGVNSGRVAELIAHYRRNIDVLLRVSVGSRLFDVLYDEIYPVLEKDSLSKAVLLEYLDDYVLDGALERPPPVIVSDYLSNLINEGHFSQLQSAVVRIPIDCIDLHKVMTTCRQNGLYDGVIYVMNRALGDYLGPLEEMLDTVASFSGRGDLLSDHEVQQGAQLLLYLHCCLAGAAYPIGALPEDQQRTVPVQQESKETLPEDQQCTVPVQVYRCITSVHGKESVGRREEGAYPYLRLLLQFDAQQFLHVVCTCADAQLFQSEDNRLQRLTEVYSRLEIVGMLSLECKSATILSEYLKFVANLVATDRILTPAETVNQGIEALLRLPALTQGEEQAVVEVMRYVTGIDMERVLRLSSRPLRVTICSHIYRLQRRFVDLLRCYLTPPVNTDSFFDVTARLLVSDLTREERTATEEYVKERIEDLCSLSAPATAALVVEHLGTYWADLRRKTTPDARRGVRQKCGEMIAEAFRLQRERGECFLTGDEEVDEWAFELAFEWGCEEGRRQDAEMKSLLLYWLPLGAKTDICLNAAAASGCRTGSVVLLLEDGIRGVATGGVAAGRDPWCCYLRTGSVVLLTVWEVAEWVVWLLGTLRISARGLLTRAFSLLHDRLEAAIAEGDEETGGGGGEALLSATDDILTLARSHPSEAAEHGWLLTLFHRIVEATRIGEGGGGRDHSPLLSSMLDSCEYEQRLLDAFVRIQAEEGMQAFGEITSLASRRLAPIIAPECATCGHMQHQECLFGEKACPVCAPDDASAMSTSTDLSSESSAAVPARRGAPTAHHRGVLAYARDDRRQKKRRNIFDAWDEEPYLGPAGEL